MGEYAFSFSSHISHLVVEGQIVKDSEYSLISERE